MNYDDILNKTSEANVITQTARAQVKTEDDVLPKIIITILKSLILL